MAAPEDLVSEATLGEPLGPGAQIAITVLLAGSVTKGQLGQFSDTEAWPPTAIAATATSKTDGVFGKAGDSGDYVPFLVLGIVKVIAGGAVTAGAAIKSDATGRAVACLAANVGLEGGKAMMSAGEADDEFLILVAPSVSGVGT